MNGIPGLWTLAKKCEFCQISSAVTHATIVGCTCFGAIAMDLTACNKQVEKQ